ncbi:CHAT domain-containing protein [Reichenbachiella carrageenanivorans]|uniref:CHAT domain-containing protein n=1 Tax=Reichenbachiella carrageenanivorans TaxID=2979869 RepID=A0ABY6CZJ4_9BACT|nr:CHAT domain-containing tetratricopeptide repeat protein [Reichenbachiella carrageenanivorans]UXX79337.1 CHAT domain-containing protein [Reichenbachiella carrageenanivorans]
MRSILFILCYVASLQCVHAQTMTYNKGEATQQKYAITFADQTQILYDGMDIKKIHQDFFLSGDRAYYTGHYLNASGRYMFELKRYLDESDMKFSDTFKMSPYGMANLVLADQLDNDDLRRFTALVNASALLYQTRGKFVKAEELMMLGLQLRGDRLGRTSPEFINSLHNLAVLKKNLGDYAESERIFDYLLPTIKTLYTEQSQRYVVALNNQSMLFAELGRTQKAIEGLDLAISKSEGSLYENFIDAERIKTNRAILAQEQGDFKLADQMYLEAMSGMQQKGFENHPDYNNLLIYYGALRVNRNDSNVLPFLTETIDGIQKKYGSKHPLLAKAILNQANYYLNQENFAAAKAAYTEALTILQAAFGDHHREVLDTLNKIGLCDWQLGLTASAKANMNQSIQGYLQQLDQLFVTMSESEKTQFWQSLKPNIDNYMAFAIDIANEYPAVLVSAYELQIHTKGILINSTTRTRQHILASGNTELIDLFKAYKQTKDLLAIYYSSTKEDIAEDDIDLTALEAKANELEKSLTKMSNEFGQTRIAPTTFAAAKAMLKPDEAAIEIVRIPIKYGANKGQVHYTALVIHPQLDQPKLASLNNGLELETKYLKSYKNLIRLKVEDDQSYLNYWAPIEELLTGMSKVYVSVDGIYNSININSLLDENGMYLIDKREYAMVPNTKHIEEIRNENLVIDPNKMAVLIGYPDYGNDEIFAPLPGTQEELNAINQTLNQEGVKTRLYMQDEATKYNITQINNPEILHIATHGFFLPDISEEKGMVMGVQVSKAQNNPLLRSGLLFTGAANIYNEELSLNNKDNGILNAYEVMNMDLNQTELVIMSACETGTGEIINGEGVYGLSRSFQVAGSNKIIMSLWKVNDEATQKLMTSFYSYWMSLGNSQAAFRKAQQKVKEEFSDPYFWGAFIMMN